MQTIQTAAQGCLRCKWLFLFKKKQLSTKNGLLYYYCYLSIRL